MAVIAWSSVSVSAWLSMPATGTPTTPAVAVTMVISEAQMVRERYHGLLPNYILDVPRTKWDMIRPTGRQLRLRLRTL